MKASNAIDEIVGSNLRAARTARRLSQSELAVQVGVSFQQIQKYEKGSNRISASTLCALASAMDIGVERFFPKEYLSAAMRAKAANNNETKPDAGAPT